MTANLLSRLQGLTAPDREADRAILAWMGFSWRGMNYWHHDDKTMWPDTMPTNFTASLDATVALCERVLPGYDWTVDKSGGRGFAGVGQSFNEEAATPAIALLIAILTALEAREK